MSMSLSVETFTGERNDELRTQCGVCPLRVLLVRQGRSCKTLSAEPNAFRFPLLSLRPQVARSP